MTTPGYEPTSRNEDALQASVERAIGKALPKIDYFRMTDEQRKRNDAAEFRRVGPEPCDQCHPELHRSKCWEDGCLADEVDPCRLCGSIFCAELCDDQPEATQ